MRILWTLFKVILGLAIAIPLGILALALMAGVVGTLVGLAILTLKLACVALVGYGLFRVARFVFAPGAKTSSRRRCGRFQQPIPTMRLRCETSTPRLNGGRGSA